MLRAATLVLGLGLVISVHAQELNPALVGEGTQTQSVELAKGAVSVTLESSGALSLNRGEDRATGGATLTVNGLSVGVGERAGSDQGAGSTPSRAGSASSGGETEPRAGQASVSSDIGLSEQQEHFDCAAATPGADELAQAVRANYRLWLLPVDCAAGAENLAELLSTQAGVVAAMEAAGWGVSDVNAITITDGIVIIGVSRSI